MANAQRPDLEPPVSAAAAKAAVSEPVAPDLDRVVATAAGYFRWLISPGEMFDVPKGMTGSWFKKIEPDEEI